MPTRLQLEALCERSGRCCLVKTQLPDGRVVLTGERCRYQNPITLLCSIYGRRLAMKGQRYQCASLKRAIRDRLLPVDCPYVKGLEGHETDIPFPGREA